MASELALIVADFETQLTTKIAVGGTSATLLSATDADGVALAAGRYFFTIDGDNSQKEYFSCALSGTALTSLCSVSRQGVETSGAVREHRVGASVKITDHSYLKTLTNLCDGTTKIDGSKPLEYDVTPTLTLDNQVVTKKYMDELVLLGADLATEAVYGVSKLSVAAASAVAPIAVGDNDPRVPTADRTAALAGTSGSPSASNKFVTNDDTAETGNSKVVRTKSTGKIDTSIVDTGISANQIVQVGAGGKLPALLGAEDLPGFEVITGSSVITSSDAQVSAASTSYAKAKEFVYNDVAGSITVQFKMKAFGADGIAAYGRVYINGSAVGAEKSFSNSSSAFQTCSDVVTVSPGDLIQLYVKNGVGSITGYYTDFRLLYDKRIKYTANTVNT